MLNGLGKQIPGSVGVLLPDMKARIVRDVHDSAESESQAETGVVDCDIDEIATKEAFTRDRRVKTGDRSRVDKEGYFFFADRVKDTLKISGIQVSPVEIENVLLAHLDITDVTVAGVSRFGRTLDEKKKNLSKYKWLRGGLRLLKSVIALSANSASRALNIRVAGTSAQFLKGLSVVLNVCIGLHACLSPTLTPPTAKYRMRVEDGFQPTIYPDEHPYLEDPVLPSLLKRLLPSSILEQVQEDLTRLGEDLITYARPLAPLVHQATLVQYDQFGRRVDRLQTSEGWRRLEEMAMKEGYVSIAHQREFGQFSRVYQFAKTMVMTGDYHVIMCPFGMADGVARTIELFGTERMKKEVHPKLISSDPSVAYLSGQWMTEKPGGSDVSKTETIAARVPDRPEDLGPAYSLNGFKWFSSAAEGNVTVALARTGSISDGSRGLSMFLIPLRTPSFPSPLSNGVQMHRLKNKIGTWGVPTAELSLNNTRGWLIGPLNGGVKTIAPVLNLTRTHAAIHAIGSLQRCLSIARAYSTVRRVKSQTMLLQDMPLHVANLAYITLVYRALTHMTFHTVNLLGKSELKIATEGEEARLRLMTPMIKAYAAHKVPPAIEEAMAALGGLGYMEEVGIGRLLRDALVEKIWEGTMSVLSLDLIRAARGDSIEKFAQWASSITKLALAIDGLRTNAAILNGFIDQLPSMFERGKTVEVAPRLLMMIFASITAGVCLLEHAVWSSKAGEAGAVLDQDPLNPNPNSNSTSFCVLLLVPLRYLAASLPCQIIIMGITSGSANSKYFPLPPTRTCHSILFVGLAGKGLSLSNNRGFLKGTKPEHEIPPAGVAGHEAGGPMQAVEIHSELTEDVESLSVSMKQVDSMRPRKRERKGRRVHWSDGYTSDSECSTSVKSAELELDELDLLEGDDDSEQPEARMADIPAASFPSSSPPSPYTHSPSLIAKTAIHLLFRRVGCPGIMPLPSYWPFHSPFHWSFLRVLLQNCLCIRLPSISYSTLFGRVASAAHIGRFWPWTGILSSISSILSYVTRTLKLPLLPRLYAYAYAFFSHLRAQLHSFLYPQPQISKLETYASRDDEQKLYWDNVRPWMDRMRGFQFQHRGRDRGQLEGDGRDGRGRSGRGSGCGRLRDNLTRASMQTPVVDQWPHWEGYIPDVPIITCYQPPLPPLPLSSRAVGPLKGEDYHLPTRTFTKWYRMVYPEKNQPTPLTASRILDSGIYTGRDKKEMRRIASLKMQLSPHPSGDSDDKIITNPYKKAWEDYLERKFKEGPEVVVVFSSSESA
ncbi:hypothetical protein D9758_011369 [Tetrapyrgos nigripes]|uniref:Acyl-CoA dehydrogenase NM domain-like protein n=1 Tax=Tetrapyrgos nigripes TaxID=182062 RepID=A0A8H5LJT5_9AGAR|nr:hypothetical protein D9758_011369 [Tetrapyrgos nigripes]